MLKFKGISFAHNLRGYAVGTAEFEDTKEYPKDFEIIEKKPYADGFIYYSQSKSRNELYLIGFIAGDGKWWSSNQGEVNKTFGTKLEKVYINNRVIYIKRSYLKSLLPSNCVIEDGYVKEVKDGQ